MARARFWVLGSSGRKVMLEAKGRDGAVCIVDWQARHVVVVSQPADEAWSKHMLAEAPRGKANG